jgi:LuxR family transcriptional regulator, quorum-sensing system regulator CviR
MPEALRRIGLVTGDGGMDLILTESSEMGSSLSRNDMAGILEIVHSCLRCESYQDFLTIILSLQRLLSFEYAYVGLVTCANDGLLVPASHVQVNFPNEFFLEYIAKGHLQTDSLVREMRRTRRLQSWPDGWRRPGQNKEIISLYKDFKKTKGYLHGSEAIASTKNESLFCFSGPSLKKSERNSAILEHVIPHLHLGLSYARDKNPAHADRPVLSVREIEVLNWLKHGKSSWDISAILSISESTVNFHVKNITQKLNAVNRTQAVAIGARLGLIDMD